MGALGVSEPFALVECELVSNVAFDGGRGWGSKAEIIGDGGDLFVEVFGAVADTNSMELGRGCSVEGMGEGEAK